MWENDLRIYLILVVTSCEHH